MENRQNHPFGKSFPTMKCPDAQRCWASGTVSEEELWVPSHCNHIPKMLRCHALTTYEHFLFCNTWKQKLIAHCCNVSHTQTPGHGIGLASKSSEPTKKAKCWLGEHASEQHCHFWGTVCGLNSSLEIKMYTSWSLIKTRFFLVCKRAFIIVGPHQQSALDRSHLS